MNGETGLEDLAVKPRDLPTLPHHREETLPSTYGPRRQWMGSEMVPGADLFITSRTVQHLEAGAEPNVADHSHPVGQTYLFFGEPGALAVEVTVDGETRLLTSPAAVFIPANRRHRLQLVQGNGTVVAILGEGSYR